MSNIPEKQLNDLFYFLNDHRLESSKTLSLYNRLRLIASGVSAQIKDEIIQYLKDNPSAHILITGAAGSGKTYLLNQIVHDLHQSESLDEEYRSNSINDLNKQWHFINKKSPLIAPSPIVLKNSHQNCLILDGLDEYTTVNDSRVKELFSTCDSCIVTCRRKALTPIELLSEIFDLVIDLDQGISPYRILEETLSLTGATISSSGFTSPIVSQLLNATLESSYDSLVKTLEQTIQQYDDTGKILLLNRSIEIPTPEITLPSKEIITGVNVLQSSLLKSVQYNPDLVHELTPREFEEFVAEAYENLGYKVELTKMTRDGGKDIILYADGPTGHNMYYVECKKYRKDRPVDVTLVRNLYGVVEADRATAGIMVTSSSFTPDARSFELQVCHRMSLLDYLDLLREVSKRQ